LEFICGAEIDSAYIFEIDPSSKKQYK